MWNVDATAIERVRSSSEEGSPNRRFLPARCRLGVSRRIEQITGGTFVVQPGSLFPALHRLEEAGWLTSDWQPSENN